MSLFTSPTINSSNLPLDPLVASPGNPSRNTHTTRRLSRSYSSSPMRPPSRAVSRGSQSLRSSPVLHPVRRSGRICNTTTSTTHLSSPTTQPTFGTPKSNATYGMKSARVDRSLNGSQGGSESLGGKGRRGHGSSIASRTSSRCKNRVH